MLRLACRKPIQRHWALKANFSTTQNRLLSTDFFKASILDLPLQNQAKPPTRIGFHTSAFVKRPQVGLAAESTNRATSEPPKLPSFWSRATELTNKEKEWTVSEEDAQKPKILRPVLFSIAVGVTAFAWAAYMTIKDNRTVALTVEREKYLDFPKRDFDKEEFTDNLFDFSEQEEVRLGVIAYFSKQSGAEDISWGDLNETQMRALRKVVHLKDRHPLGIFKGLYEYMETNRSLAVELIKPILLLPSTLYATYRYVLPVRLSDEKLAALPICASMVSIALVLKLGKKGLFGKSVNGFLRRHMMRTPSAIRLHTLVTSTFSHTRFVDVVQYSGVILLIGSSYLELPKTSKEGKPLHTAEATTFYHFLAFCVAAGAFANVSSQIFSRILLQNVGRKYGHQIAKKLIGRAPESGAGGIAGALIGNYLYHSPCWEEYSNNERITLHTGIACGSAILLIFEAGVLTLGFIDRRYLGGIDRAARLGGAVFGLMYARFGNAFWESMKRFFYDCNEQLLINMNQTSKEPQISTQQPLAITEEIPTIMEEVRLG
ncbi:uncharacterized protein FA14DRAFT_192785 [Meira miltonrushii]|uniref:Peptidase S54 rhomboid domain-containing protein n=1 Tax=Meira miltonrushii TaxID=1280837 RepID=A0A316V675_9BASI|nr:uncharacterized protein FA14DRAFT_192785 [Meira miltonrushii]PWN31713.1 hypothetical protein FA14DRAFT_192785 [Meira miltonrushii]